MLNLKQLSLQEKKGLAGGHRACSGCGFPQAINMIFGQSTVPVVTTCATGCMEIATTIYPFTAWRGNFMHSAFENAAATISGIETAYRSLKKQGRLPGDDKMNFVAIGGDGGTYDIGFQALSGAMERRHNILYICYNNEAYMNTGVQRSSATPKGGHTTTSPAGKVVPGKVQFPKDLTHILAAHDLAYAGQASVGYHLDLMRKADKAFSLAGPKFMNVYTPCRLGWGSDPSQSMEIARLAVETCLWPLYEVVDGEWKLTRKIREKKPVTDFYKTQTRFRHLLKPENEELVKEIQAEVDKRWHRLLLRCGEGA
ncbi:pyruvate ferredoxin oxidoreductase [candidate division FCPU426 bacterium]|nr:pyruvate ferredoxin oxidoreductase [candidate division FCPU426 bacterium]